ncbi:MAG: PadR family transcriptional regulator [Candidatus Marsarchaeota archaeon]|nr:PadR family transcriptional regulator [Candidatus Marsarchaeota archaeon]
MQKSDGAIPWEDGRPPYARRELRHVIMKLMLLKQIKSGRTYPYALVKYAASIEMAHGFERTGAARKNDVYNTLASLERSGYIKAKRAVSGGRVKKYYSITPDGSMVLRASAKELMRTIRLVKELLG